MRVNTTVDKVPMPLVYMGSSLLLLFLEEEEEEEAEEKVTSMEFDFGSYLPATR